MDISCWTRGSPTEILDWAPWPTWTFCELHLSSFMENVEVIGSGKLGNRRSLCGSGTRCFVGCGRAWNSADECFPLASAARLVRALHVYLSSVS
jgi:hypothetical protein